MTYDISTDKAQLDVAFIHKFLSEESYWAQNIPRELVQKAIDHSFCFGVYQGEQQVGFARVITDFTTFAYLSDVFVDKAHRGRGVSKQLVQAITEYPDLQGLRRWVLATNDAHTLYTKFGFTALDQPELYMHRKWNSRY